MTEFYTWFAGLHGMVEFAIILLFGCIIRVIFQVINRILRTIKVSRHGWPPAHIDADGDWKPTDER